MIAARLGVGRRTVTLAVLMLSLISGGVARAAGDANSSQCSGETEASSGFHTYLPDCRAYELVTPPYKAGAVILADSAEPASVSADGNHVITGAGGAFAGAGNDWFQLNRNSNFDAYEFSRTEQGWQTTALTPPGTVFPHSTLMAAADSPTLSPTLWGAQTSTIPFSEDIYLRDEVGTFTRVGPGVAPEVREEGLPEPDNELEFSGASQDLSHSLFWIQAFTEQTKEAHHGHSNLWPGDSTALGGNSLYEYTTKAGAAIEPRLVGVSNAGPLKSNAEAHLVSSCGTELGSSKVTGGQGSAYNAVSASGALVFFTAMACSGGPPVNELQVRRNAAETVNVSEPSVADCEVCDTTSNLADAHFVGASRNGERVFFTTEQPLIPGQEGANLYEYNFTGPSASPAHPSGRIELVSEGVADPEVQGVARISEDGSHVYFVAKGLLASANKEGRSPEQGADNLYLYETGSGGVAFVATLLTATEEAALAVAEEQEELKLFEIVFENFEANKAAIEHKHERGESSEEQEHTELKLAEEEFEEEFEQLMKRTPGTRGPRGTLATDRSVWSSRDERPVQATPTGDSLVFPSSAHLTSDQSGDVPQLYQYDASHERITRVSIGDDLQDGNVSTFHEAPVLAPVAAADIDLPTADKFGRALPETGESVFFTSSAQLSSVATPGSTNVYEYRDGATFLISGGKDESEYATGGPTVKLFGIDPTGRDALFLTADPLVQQSAETQMALVDARESGGFPFSALVGGCLGETCRGGAGGAPSLSQAGSSTQPGEQPIVPPIVTSKPALPKQVVSKRTKELRRCAKMRRKKRRKACNRAVARRARHKGKAGKAGGKTGKAGRRKDHLS